MMFGMVLATGIRILARADYNSNRHNLYIVAISLGVGMIPTVSGHFFQHFPAALQPLFHSGILLATLSSVLLNLFSTATSRTCATSRGPCWWGRCARPLSRNQANPSHKNRRAAWLPGGFIQQACVSHRSGRSAPPPPPPAPGCPARRRSGGYPGPGAWPPDLRRSCGIAQQVAVGLCHILFSRLLAMHQLLIDAEAEQIAEQVGVVVKPKPAMEKCALAAQNRG